MNSGARSTSTLDLDPDRVVDEHDPGNSCTVRIEQGVADDVSVRLRPAEIGAGLQGGDEWREHEGRQQGGDEEAGKDAQGPLGEEAQGSPVSSKL